VKYTLRAPFFFFFLKNRWGVGWVRFMFFGAFGAKCFIQANSRWREETQGVSPPLIYLFVFIAFGRTVPLF